MQSYMTRIYNKRQISNSQLQSNRRNHTSETPAMAPNHEKSAIESGRSAKFNMEMPTCGELVDEGEGLVVVGHFGDWTGLDWAA